MTDDRPAPERPTPPTIPHVLLAADRAFVHTDTSTGRTRIGVGLEEATGLAMQSGDLVRPLYGDVFERFAQAWAHGDVADLVAHHLSCHETDTLADLLRALGRDDAAQDWTDQHATADEPGDTHHLDGAESRGRAKPYPARTLDSAEARAVLDDLRTWAQTRAELVDDEEADDEERDDNADKAVLLAERLAALLLGPGR